MGNEKKTENSSGGEQVVRLYGVCCGLLVFSAMILTGVLAQAPIERIILRSIVGLFAGYLLGCAGGWLGGVIAADQPATRTADANAADSGPSPANIDAPAPQPDAG